MSLKSNQEVFLCRDSEDTWPTTAGPPLMHRVLGCSKMIQLRWFCLFIRKSSPQENILRSFYPRRLLYHCTAKGSIYKGCLEWTVPAEVMSGLKRTQVPSSSSSTTSTPLAGTSCASCSPSCRERHSQGTGQGWLLQALPQLREQHGHGFLSKSVLAPKHFTLRVIGLSSTDP